MWSILSGMLPAGDQKLVQILDVALADSAQRSGDWLVCHPGCTQCCIGVFSINQLDAERLRSGLDELARNDPARAAALVERVQSSIERLALSFPGDPVTGLLDTSDEAQAQFEEFANDEPCPVLDPVTGLCDLYAYRPVACRVFGPPVRSRSGPEDGLGICELCYHGATGEQIAACEMVVDPDGLETQLLRELAKDSSARRSENTSGDEQKLTLVPFALAQRDPHECR
jgi:Fe-S-cluster containining protein